MTTSQARGHRTRRSKVPEPTRPRRWISPAGAAKGNPNFSEAKSKPGGTNSKSGPHQESPAKLKQRKSLDFLRRIEPYQGFTRTPTAFFISCAASRLKGGHGAASALPVRPDLVRFLCLRFGFSGLLEQVKGWRRFDRGRSDAVCPDLGGREPQGTGTERVDAIVTRRAAGSVRGQQRDPGEKDRAIDPMSGKNTSAEEEPDPGSSLWLADGRQPFIACECLTMPVFEPYPFGFAIRGGSGRFLSGAFSAFHPAIDHY